MCSALPAKDPSEGEIGWAVGRMASMSGWRISGPDKHVRERDFDGPPGRHTGNQSPAYAPPCGITGIKTVSTLPDQSETAVSS